MSASDHDLSLIERERDLPADEPYPIHHDPDEYFAPIDCDCWADQELAARDLYCPACEAERTGR